MKIQNYLKNLTRGEELWGVSDTTNKILKLFEKEKKEILNER